MTTSPLNIIFDFSVSEMHPFTAQNGVWDLIGDFHLFLDTQNPKK